MGSKKILVVGSGGALGKEIVRTLTERGHGVIAAYRTERAGLKNALAALGATPVRLDLRDESLLSTLLSGCDGAIFTPILSASAPAASLLRDDQPVVFFSSNNVAIDPDNKIYARLGEAERATRAAAPQAVILRPTMIYGYPGDGNISRLITTMRRWPVLPMPGNGQALQQPVYVADLARIAAGLLEAPERQGETLAVAGPEGVTQKALFAIAATAAGANLRAIPLPLGMMAHAAAALEAMGIRPFVGAAQLRRAGADKVPHGPQIMLGKTPLEQGVRALADALDGTASGA